MLRLCFKKKVWKKGMEKGMEKDSDGKKVWKKCMVLLKSKKKNRKKRYGIKSDGNAWEKGVEKRYGFFKMKKKIKKIKVREKK